ncbi:MAG: hypothetical protein AB7P23_06215 [Amphiplicatus sp.]
MTAIPMDSTSRVRTLIALTEELAAIFSSENAALLARRPSELAPLQVDKARLAAAYAQSIREIAADRSLVDGAGDLLLENLKSVTQLFEKRAVEQRVLLDGARLASEGVMRAVAAEAGAAAKGPAYRRDDAAPKGAAPIAFDEKA